MKHFTPLTAALADFFDKTAADIPKDLGELIEDAFYPRQWDRLTPEQRKQHAAHCDYENDPSNQERIEAIGALVSSVYATRKELSEWQSIPAPTASDLNLKNAKIAELSAKLHLLEEKLGAARGDDPAVETETSGRTGTPVTADWIRANFVLFPDEGESDRWWKDAMANASRNNGLRDCRLGKGIKGKPGTLWFPDRIALWLIDRHDRELPGSMSAGLALESLTKFDGYAEIAEDLKERFGL